MFVKLTAVKEAIEESLEGLEDSTIHDDNPYDALGELNAIFGMVDYF